MFEIVAKTKWEKEQLEWAFDDWQFSFDDCWEWEDREKRIELGIVKWNGRTLKADFEGFDNIMYRLDNMLRDIIYKKDLRTQKREFPRLNILIDKMESVLDNTTV